jgi:hypothetical protein
VFSGHFALFRVALSDGCRLWAELSHGRQASVDQTILPRPLQQASYNDVALFIVKGYSSAA